MKNKETVETKKVHVGGLVSPELRTKFRIAAAERNEPIGKLFEQALEAFIKKGAK